MIELLLEADQAATIGLLDKAERLYEQAIERDPGNAIAVAGLARVALDRGDERAAHALAAAALAIDPEEYAARRIAARTADVLAARGEALPSPAAVGSAPRVAAREPPAAGPSAPRPSAPRRSLLGRLLGRR